MLTPLAQRFCHPLWQRVCRRPRSPLSLAADDICTDHCGSRLASVVVEGRSWPAIHLHFTTSQPAPSRAGLKVSIQCRQVKWKVTSRSRTLVARSPRALTIQPGLAPVFLKLSFTNLFFLFHLSLPLFSSSRRNITSLFSSLLPSITAESAGDPAYRRATNSVLRRSREDLGALSTLRCFQVE